MAFDTSVVGPATIPAEDEALRARIRDFLSTRVAHLPAEKRARSWMGFDADFSRDLGTNGWLGLTLPREYGGQGLSGYARFVVLEELLAVGAPVAAHWIADRQSAPLLLRYGTEEQKRKLVPSICRGELHFCIGMSEPDSGSDLASVRSRAAKTANGWKLDGAKIWTTYGHRAHYMIALVRTSGSPDDRNKGLSQFLVDLSLPGIRRSPILDIAGDEHFSEIRFDGVELAEDALLGSEGAGWEQVNAELAFERSGPERIYSSMVLMDEWLTFVRSKRRQTEADMILAGRLAGQLAALREMSLSVTRKLASGGGAVFDASIVKDLGTTFEQDVPRMIADHLAASADELPPASLLAALEYVGAMCPSFSLRGGTREILRGMIARGLGLR